MKKSIMKATGIGLLSACLLFAPEIEAKASPLVDASGYAGVTATLENYYDTMTAKSESAGIMVTAAVDTVSPVSVVSGYTNLGVAHVDNYLNVREEPSEEAKLVGKMTKNAGCEILEVVGDWSKIKSGKVTGYVSNEYLYTGSEANTVALDAMVVMATVNTTTLKVREEASLDSKVVTLIPIEEKLEVLEDAGDWVKIGIDGDEGYISKEYVDLSSELPTATTLTELKYGQGVSDIRVSLVEFAMKFLGNRYVWGGTSLTNGTDCSGFTMSIYRNFGISINRTSGAQASNGTRISPSDARPGDLIFYGKGSSINHVAMAIGGGQVIHASSARTGIKISNMYYRTPITATRIIND